VKKREYRDYLQDILVSINDIESFTVNMDFLSFQKDKKTIYAVIRCIEVLGEAAKKMPKSIRDKYPRVPWSVMVGMRNRMVHEYFGVDLNILWQTVKEDIPSLKQVIKDASGWIE
jgi:uncharacterized protein with HEPN domain